MPQRSGRSVKRRTRGSRADRLVTLAVILFLVLIVGGAMALQLGGTPARTVAPPAITPFAPPAAATPADNIQRITAANAKAMVDAGQAVLVDVRSRQSYEAEHAVGAIAFPEDEQESLLAQLPPDKSVIVYCA